MEKDISSKKKTSKNSSKVEEVKKGKDSTSKASKSTSTKKKSTSKSSTKKTASDSKKTTTKKSTKKVVESSVDKLEESVSSKENDNVKEVTLDKEVIIDEEKFEDESKSTNHRKSSSTAKSNSIVVDVIEEDLDRTGAIKTIDDGKFFSEILSQKLISIQKINKSSEEDDKFDGTFIVDILDILIIVVITAIVSCLFTGFILNYQYKKTSDYVNGTIISDENVKDFLSLYAEILDNYYEEVDAEAIMKAAMKGMLSYLEDTYSIYLSDEETDNLNELLDSSYEGIGVVMQGNVIKGVYKNSSAANAGIKVDDVIVKVNDIAINMENYVDIGEYLKKDEENTIVVKRNGEELSFKVSFSKVNVPTSTSTVISSKDSKIGYIRLTSFSTLSFEDFQESLMEVEDEKINSLIIDLRSNSGGYLKAAYDIASLFVEKGKVIYSLEQKDKITEYKDKTSDKRNYKVVVLINNSTASAAEVLASALHDSYGAKIVGKTSFGKGTVQTIKQFDDDSVVKYTSAKWLRPNGECINGVGITPDYEVEIEYSNSQIYDKQLDKAIELLS